RHRTTRDLRPRRPRVPRRAERAILLPPAAEGAPDLEVAGPRPKAGFWPPRGLHPCAEPDGGRRLSAVAEGPSIGRGRAPWLRLRGLRCAVRPRREGGVVPIRARGGLPPQGLAA